MENGLDSLEVYRWYFGGAATLIAVLISLNKGKTIQEESEIRENVLIVYYDLVLGLTDLKKIYINMKTRHSKIFHRECFQ